MMLGRAWDRCFVYHKKKGEMENFALHQVTNDNSTNTICCNLSFLSKACGILKTHSTKVDCIPTACCVYYSSYTNRWMLSVEGLCPAAEVLTGIIYMAFLFVGIYRHL